MRPPERFWVDTSKITPQKGAIIISAISMGLYHPLNGEPVIKEQVLSLRGRFCSVDPDGVRIIPSMGEPAIIKESPREEEILFSAIPTGGQATYPQAR